MLALRGRRHRVTELAFSPCGRWLAAAGSRGGVHVWDTTNPSDKPRHTDLGGAYWSGLLAFRPDGRLFCCDARHNWFLFNPAARELVELVRPRPSGWFFPTPDALHAVSVENHATLEYWTIPSEIGEASKRRWAAQEPAWNYSGVAFARDGAALACTEAHDGKRHIAVRDTTTGEVRTELATSAASIPQMAFAGGEFLIGRSAATLTCWNLAKPEEKPRKATNPTRKHFQSMAAHPAGPVLTVDNDRLVRVWDTPALTPYRTIEWNIGKLYAVAVSPDGARAAVGSHTGKVLLWDWD